MLRRTIAFVILLLAGCTTSQGVAKAMYTAQYNCPEEKLEWENLAGYRAIMVRGCGYQQLYACNPQGGACVRDGERTPIGGASTK
jgi:hypothetical protein